MVLYTGASSSDTNTCISFLLQECKNYCQLGGLTQHKFVILRFCWSEVYNRSHGAELKMSAGCIPISSPFPAYRGCLHSVSHDPLLHPQSQHLGISALLPWSHSPYNFFLSHSLTRAWKGSLLLRTHVISLDKPR